MLLRRATLDDIPELMRVRLAVQENRLLDPGRVTVADCAEHVSTLGAGWVVEAPAGGLAGFAIGRITDGNIWALFVDPLHEQRGIGSRLHDTLVGWLFGQGLPLLWLTTGTGTRAETFYRHKGWVPCPPHPADEIRFELRPPFAAAVQPAAQNRA